jgi:PDZ domain-containing protein
MQEERTLGQPPPPPPGIEPVRGPRVVRWIVAAVIALALIVASNYIPLPFFYAYLPGPMRNVEDLVSVSEGQTYSSEGKLYLTTVSIDTDVTVAEWFRAVVDPEVAIVMKDDVTGGTSLKELEEQQRAEMDASKQHAEEVALTALGLATPKGDGARVTGTIEGAPAEGVLQRSDVIVAVDGQEVDTTCDVGRAVDRVAIGDPVEITVKRDGAEETFTIETERNPQDPTTSYVGIFMTDVNYEFDPGFIVDFETGKIAGPSAGLMFSLALYDRLTPEDLTAGREIAGTGTIQCDGGVGPIGGIEQKIAAAEAIGASVFLAPEGNFENAEAAASDIEVVSISNFDDAVRYLEDLE